MLTLCLLWSAAGGSADRPFLTLASTTSTRDSGLIRYLVPRFRSLSGADVRVVAVGTGRALELGRRGDVDVVLVHARQAEDRFMADGHGLLRRDVMYNDFVIVGPRSDPAGVAGTGAALAAFARIAEHEATFLSRGDDSGTHQAERRLWAMSGVEPSASSDRWYRETGNGMGATLNTASQLGSYSLSDRGTWIAFRNRGDLRILFEGDPPLHNPYGVMIVNPERHPHVKVDLARRFVEWLVSDEGQRAIADFRLEGQQLFYPSAGR